MTAPLTSGEPGMGSFYVTHRPGGYYWSLLDAEEGEARGPFATAEMAEADAFFEGAQRKWDEIWNRLIQL